MKKLTNCKRFTIVLGLICVLILQGCGLGSNDSTDEVTSYDFYEDSLSESFMPPDDGMWGNPDNYLTIHENRVIDTSEEPILTFSLHMNSASYRRVVRYINDGLLPPADAVRTEEMINYFTYDEILRASDSAFAFYSEIGVSPFNSDKHLAFVRVQTQDIDREELPNSNLTFLIDTSGSMAPVDRLPLLQEAFGYLIESLTADDVVSIVTYAGCSEVILDSVPGDQHEKITAAINGLEARGSTHGEGGIRTAYALARKNMAPALNNRVILATDGDFNVGVTGMDELEELILEESERGIYLTILGVGMGNSRDNTMETLAKHGNGNYAYLDTIREARRVLGTELHSHLFTIADDVRAQVNFNPYVVANYRLIGYENRLLDNEDFENDEVNAGEIGVDTDIVLMFELELIEHEIPTIVQLSNTIDTVDNIHFLDELFQVQIRYKNPGEDVSNLITHLVTADRILDNNTNDFNFAASVAGFGHLLRDSDYKGDITSTSLLNLAQDSTGRDEFGIRREFIEILREYQQISY